MDLKDRKYKLLIDIISDERIRNMELNNQIESLLKQLAKLEDDNLFLRSELGDELIKNKALK